MLASLGRAFSLLFGKISWNTPPWINSLHHLSKEKPKAFWGSLILLLLLLMTALGSFYWYQSLPKPVRITAQIKPPKITPNTAELIPDEIAIDFGISTPHEFIPRAAAPLQALGKPVTTGVTITPFMPGEWTWTSDNHLIFTPHRDWPAGQTYRIRFDQPFFAKAVHMERMEYEFSTLPFEAMITDFKFYQDPVRPEIRQAAAQINFNYPVDVTSLENNLTLMWQVLDKGAYYLKSQHFKYTIDYDQNKRIAYLHSENLPLPPVSRFLDLIIKKGVKPVSGPSILDESLKANVLIPDKASFFKVKDLSTSIVRNPKDNPEQVLNLETTLGLTQDELNKFLHVYLLPKDYPKTAAFLARPNYQWREPGEVTQDILALATPLTLQAIPTDIDYASLHSFKYAAPESRYLYIKLNKGVRGFGNYDLANDYAAILKVPAYPQEISFLHKGALLALGTEEKLSVLVRGLPAVKFDFARILPNDLNHLITQTYGDFSNPQFINTTFNQNNVSQISTDIQLFDAHDPAKSQYTALDLKKYLLTPQNGKHPLGLFLLRASGFDPEKKYELGIQNKRLILMTDLGLLVKDNSDGSHDVFVESITQGLPVNQALVSVLGKNGIAIFTASSDANGHVHFPALSDFINEREPVVYLVEQGNDVSFIPYNRVDRELNYSRFDVGGITHHQDESALTAYVFSDRGIYRPGDLIHIAMIVKEPYVEHAPLGVPLEATLIDPRGVTVKNEKITLNDMGFFTFDFQSNETSSTGQYSVNLYIVKDNHPSSLIGSTTINIADFLPDRMRISAHLSQEQPRGWISPKDLTLNVNLVNLYGTPAMDHRVSAKMILSPQAVTFKEFPQYTFLDPLLNPQSPPKVFTETLTDTHTNAKGEASFALKLNRFEKATYQLSIFAEGFELAGGRSVATRTTALVSPLAYLVGYKPDGDLNYIKQSTERKVKFIAINPALAEQILSGLELRLYKLHPVTTLIKKPDGTYQYQSIMQTTKISNQPFAIDAGGTFYALPTQTIGDFLVTLVDNTGTELSRLKYSVVGASQQTLPKNAELDVKLNKSIFLAGDEIEMQITAPYTGAGLITIERDKTYAFQWFKTNTTTSLQKIHIPNDFKGNGYINVAFMRDINSPEIFTSPLSYSVVPFSVNHEDRHIKIDLNIPSLSEPGELFPITYKADKPCKMIIFAVDEGILQTAGYEDPDPLKFFFEKRALEVKTLQIVDQILPKFIAQRELSSVGGDGGEEAIKKYLNPFKRKTEAPVVYWSYIVDADTTSRKLAYAIPDYFNGSLRVMAVAVTENAVGSAAKNAIVRGPFVINPNVPTFVTPGDEFDITATVANNIEGPLNNTKISINIETGAALQIIGKDQENIIIPEGQERSVHFRIRAKSLLGSTAITFKAQLNNKITKMSATLSVRPASPYFTSITSGYATTASKMLKVDRILFPAYKKVTAAVSQSPLVLATGMQHYLDNFPYGCTEQLVSKAFPLLAMINQPWFMHDAEQINTTIQKTILMLSERQMSNGGFSYWPAAVNFPSNEFISVYAMHFLTEAKAQGYAVPNEVFASGLSFLKDLVSQNINSLEQARTQAYAIYLLTRNEIVTTNYLTRLQLDLDNHPAFNWHRDITSAYIASAYQLLKSSYEANKIIRYFRPQIANDNTVHENTDFYNPSIANAQYLYLIAKHFPEQSTLIKLDFILSLVDALNNDSITTILSSYTTLAFAHYGQSNTALSSLSIAETLQNGHQQTLFTPNRQYKTAILNDAAVAVTFINPSKQGYFYQLVQTGFDQIPSKQAVNQGIEVYREFQNDEGKVVDTAFIGDELTVHLRARSVNNTYQDNIAIVDLLPGGFEVIRDSIPHKMDYVDVREDRVIFFGSLNPDSTDIVYRIKATNTGKFTIPPIYAASMYQPSIKSLGSVSNVSITKRKQLA